MKLKKPSTITALLLLTAGASGCFGGSGDNSSGGGSVVIPPPPPPPPSGFTGGLWTGAMFWEPRDGFPGGAMNVRALVAENGDFHWVLHESDQLFGNESEQVFGRLEFEGTEVRTTTPDVYQRAVWATSVDSGNLIGDLWGGFALFGTVEDHGSFSGNFQSSHPNFEERAGTFTLNYHSLYERDSSLETLQGVYSTATESLVIDDQGAIFYQSSENGCTGNGSAAVIDSHFNMYRMYIFLGSCTGNHAIRNGLTFAGLAYMGVNDDPGGGFISDTIEIGLSAAEGVAFDTPPVHYFIWNLRAEKE